MGDELQDDPLVEFSPPATRDSISSAVYRQSNNGKGFNRGAQGRSNESNWRNRGNSSMESGDIDENQPSSSKSTRKVISVPSHKVGRIIGRGGIKIRDLEFESYAKIKVGEAYGNNTNITLFGNPEATARAEEMINILIADHKPAPPPRDPDIGNIAGSAPTDFFSKLGTHDAFQQHWWSNLPKIIKNFYVEDPAVTAMSHEDVSIWRKENNNIKVKRTFENKTVLRPIPNPVLTFEQAFWNFPPILQEIYKEDFEKPSSAQCQCWPILLSGDDMIGISQTGTGKTLAFLLPALIHIAGQTTPRDQRKGPTVFILTPTAEKALQIDKEVSKYQYNGINSVSLYGGADHKLQIDIVSKGVDILIATPERLDDIVTECVHNFSFIVLDEADTLLDLGFEPQIRKCLSEMRPDRQTVMTSTSWPIGLRRLVTSFMQDPILVIVGSLDSAAAAASNPHTSTLASHSQASVYT